jgi:hypothetical protein
MTNPPSPTPTTTSASLALPAVARLGQLVRSLGQHLPPEFATMLAAPRFSDGAAALARLSQPEHLAAALAGLSEQEAGRLADRLLARWQRVGGVRLEPAVALTGPREVWVGARPVAVTFHLIAVGLADGWETVWEGATPGADPARSAEVEVAPINDEISAPLIVRARVRARTPDGRRTIEIAEASLHRRRPVVTILPPTGRPLSLTIADHTGAPAAGVRVDLGGDPLVADAAGHVTLPATVAPGTLIRVEGIPAGRLDP